MIQSKYVNTRSIRTHYLECGDSAKDLVVLLHGNVSSALFFEPLMQQMGGRYHFVAPDMRGYGDSETLPVLAKDGLKTFSEDLHHFLDVVNLEGKKIHLMGWSLGGAVVLQLAMDHPQHIASITLESPMSPFGFGGSINTGIVLKAPVPDFAGSGGGAVNPVFIDSIRTRDGQLPSTQPEGLRASPPFYARATMNGFYFKMRNGKTLLQNGIIDQATEDLFTESMFKTKLGDGNYPGNTVVSSYWPGMAPGDKGVNNAISAKHCDLSGFAASGLSIPVLWIRGADDLIVSDHSFLDLNNLGRLGHIPGWPGEDTHPPQPMVSQMRSVLEAYRQKGGAYTELVFEDCGHSPHIEHAQKFIDTFLGFIAGY